MNFAKCGVGTHIILEQMLEHKMESKIIMTAGAPLYTITFYQYYKAINSLVKSGNLILKSIWLYNNETVKNNLSDTD